MRRQGSSDVKHRSFYGVSVPRDAQIGALEIRIDEHGEIVRVDVAVEMHAVHLG